MLELPSFDEKSIVHDKVYIANKLGISVQELDGYMELPRRTYRDYKNQMYVYKLGSMVLSKLGFNSGVKR
jgi:hypothetical protein